MFPTAPWYRQVSPNFVFVQIVPVVWSVEVNMFEKVPVIPNMLWRLPSAFAQFCCIKDGVAVKDTVISFHKQHLSTLTLP